MFRTHFKRLKAHAAIARFAIRRHVFARLPFALLDAGARANWLMCAPIDGRVRSTGIARYEAGRVEVGLGRRDALSVMSAQLRERWIDERLYAARALGSDAWPDLRAAAAQLAAHVRQIKSREPGRIVVLSPFHYVSQYANIYVVDEVRRLLELNSLSVVSGVPRDVLGNDAQMIPSVQVLYTYDENSGSRNSLGLRVIRAMRRDGVVVVFSDVPPFALAKYPMETVGVAMNGQPARLHNGVFRLGAPVNAVLLSFYLRFERGRFSIDIFSPIPLADPSAPQRVADDIAAARRANYPHWLFAGHPSVYHFAATR
ncbi:hypothetical protein [Paraburkholderia bannensis]|uniref:hypothetical protein n=1 Tax=Paraburkholderia bannensis TaxID=765414 RepID=UPI0005AAD552|nr:hypothetical protein [Paraburkholderia bannensis]